MGDNPPADKKCSKVQGRGKRGSLSEKKRGSLTLKGMIRGSGFRKKTPSKRVEPEAAKQHS